MAPTIAGQPIEWSGYSYPVKEPDATAGQQAGIVEPTAAAYGYYALEYYKQQAAVAAATAQHQVTTPPTLTTYTDPYTGAPFDFQQYQNAYSAAVSLLSTSNAATGAYSTTASGMYDYAQSPYILPTASSQPPQSQSMSPYQLPVTSGSVPMGLGWQQSGGSASYPSSPSRIQQLAAQLNKGFGSTGHGAGQQCEKEAA